MNAAEVARYADAATQVVAQSQRRPASGDKGRFAARAAARRAAAVPRIVCAAINRIVALVPGHHLRQVGLAEENGSRALEPADEQGVLFGDVSHGVADS